MARPLRIEFPGAIYHVTSRGNERRPIVRTNRDRLAFLGFLAVAAKRFNWSVTAWVLMTNHFHLVIQTYEANLSRGMHWLNSAYAGWYNHVHKRSGHLFQGRFKSFLVEKDTYLAEVLRYVVLNPVRAKMVARPEDYRWSSYRATAGFEQAPAWLDIDTALSMFGGDAEASQATYREFVLAKVDSDDCLWDRAINGIYLGTEQWAKKMRAIVESKPRSTDYPRKHRAVGRPKMHEVMATVARVSGTTVETIRARRGGLLRQLVSWIGWHEGLVTLRTIAASLRLRSEGHISNLIRRCELRFNRDPVLLGWLDQSIAALKY
jgi:REP-associated tyrosine transposase